MLKIFDVAAAARELRHRTLVRSKDALFDNNHVADGDEVKGKQQCEYDNGMDGDDCTEARVRWMRAEWDGCVGKVRWNSMVVQLSIDEGLPGEQRGLIAASLAVGGHRRASTRLLGGRDTHSNGL